MTSRIYVSLLARQTARLATKHQSDTFQRLSTNLGRQVLKHSLSLQPPLSLESRITRRFYNSAARWWRSGLISFSVSLVHDLVVFQNPLPTVVLQVVDSLDIFICIAVVSKPHNFGTMGLVMGSHTSPGLSIATTALAAAAFVGP